MYTGVRIEWIEGLDQDPSSSGQMPKQKSNQLNWSISRTEGAKSETTCGCTHLVPKFPSDFSGLLVFIYATERKTRSKLPTLGIIEPLPGLLAALATLSVR